MSRMIYSRGKTSAKNHSKFSFVEHPRTQRKVYFFSFLSMIKILCVCVIISAAIRIPVFAQSAIVSLDQAEKFELFFEVSDYKYSLYEPFDACYIGADIVTGKKMPMEIGDFEKLVGKNHGIYLNTMKADEPFPVNWASDCVEKSRIPCIVIEPVSRNISQTEAYLEVLAERLGEYYIPMFVQLFPVSLDYDRDEYIRIFRKAYEIFKKKASNVALVFTMSEIDAIDPLSYYPGNDYVDWVGLNILQTIGKSGDYTGNSLKVLDLFYYTFQKDKPIMISQLAISHFSSMDHVYRNNAATAEIKRVYHAIAESYPRIKCVIYRDINAVNIGLYDNFSITDNPDILDSYKTAIANKRFTANFHLSSPEKNLELMKSPFPALLASNKFYIPVAALRYDLGIIGLSAFGTALEFEGLSYYHSDILKSTYRDLVTDTAKKHVKIISSRQVKF